MFVGLSLWGMIKRTRLGMIIRAGVDDRPMVEALGINVPIVFAAMFFLGSLLAGMAGVLGGTMISVDKANDVEYLLASLIVVIIGGMGSLGGAAVGALLYGLVDSYGDVYLPGRLRELLGPRHLRAARPRPRRAAARALREAGVKERAGGPRARYGGRRGRAADRRARRR